MAGRKSTFAFDLSKPLKKGTLLKQGALHKAFKHREFIIYPGFMVYYENESKWKLDLTKGETLGGRLGAVKLRKATVSIARNAPKACKYGLMVNAPDPANKRVSYLMNASSKEERDQWIEAIRNAIPVSPHLNRKDIGQKEAKKEPVKAAEKPPQENGSAKSDIPPHPSYTSRQDTAFDAAVAAASCTDTQKEQEAVDVVTASVTSSLKEVSSSLKDDTGILSRHDTATLAAITLSTSMEHHGENGLLAEDKEQVETNIDLILGKQDEVPHSSEDDSGSCFSTTPEPVTPNMMSPEPEEATEMETKETVENGNVVDGEMTITTTVTVACSSNSNSQESAENSPSFARKEKTPTPEDKEPEDSLQANGETRGRSTSSTQVLINDTDEHVTLSVNLNNYDSDNTLSDEESHTELPQLSGSEKSPSPASPPKSPITIKEDRTGTSPTTNGDTTANGSPTTNGELVPPTNQRRRTSTPFVEKKGFLYKMGGQRKSWKLRYFVLRPGVFNYFKDSSSHKAIGEVKLKNLSIFFPGIGERKQSFQFTVHTESSWNKRSDYVFAAQSEREMKEWITAFKLAGQKSGSSPAPDSD